MCLCKFAVVLLSTSKSQVWNRGKFQQITIHSLRNPNRLQILTFNQCKVL